MPNYTIFATTPDDRDNNDLVLTPLSQSDPTDYMDVVIVDAETPEGAVDAFYELPIMENFPPIREQEILAEAGVPFFVVATQDNSTGVVTVFHIHIDETGDAGVGPARRVHRVELFEGAVA